MTGPASPGAREHAEAVVRDLMFARARIPLYDLLARLYTYPVDGATLAAVAAVRLEDAPVGLADALAMMQECIAAAPDPQALVDELNVEATRLFEGPGQPAAPPFASFYLHQGRLMGPAALAAQQAYRARNVRPRAELYTLPDHVALELGFVAFLAREARVTENRPSRDESRRFLRVQLEPWMPRFCARVRAATAHPFFLGLAAFTDALLELDAQWGGIAPEAGYASDPEVLP